MKLSNVNRYFEDSRQVVDQMDFDKLVEISDFIKSFLNQNRSIFMCGNGGSAYCASHFVTDLAKMVPSITNQKLKIFSLTDNVGILTAYANDVDYKSIFTAQLANYAGLGDAVFAISGSGNSPNVVECAKYANSKGIKVISFTGFDGGELKNNSDFNLHVPSFNMQIVEDVHVQILHILMRELIGDL